MSGSVPGPDRLDPCGCCAAPSLAGTTVNRPGLPALRYRIGSYATFFRCMLARLPLQEVPGGESEGTRPLQALTTRSADDPSIALLDAWATVADVLTFYQERIANEGFLGTASERRSVLELARAIGYELRPGVAASTYLAFTVEEPAVKLSALPPEQRALQNLTGTTSPTTAIVAAGSPVQSVPGPGETPQTFETAEELEARLEWNALRPRLTQPQALDAQAQTVWVQGIVTDLKAGGRVLFLTEDDEGAIAAGPRRVVAVTPEDAENRTRLDLADAAASLGFVPPARSDLVYARPTVASAPLEKGAVDDLVLGQAWKEKDLAAMVGIQGWSADALTSYAFGRRFQPSLAPAPSFNPSTLEPGLSAFTVKSAAFGHNAPRHASLPLDDAENDENRAYPADWDTLARPSVAEDSQRVARSDVHFYFERVVPEVLPASWVLLEAGGESKVVRVTEAKDASLADFALSGRATGVLVRNADGTDVESGDFADFDFRSTTLHAGSRPLVLAELPIETEIGKGTPEESQLTLDGLVLGLATGRPLAVTGERADLPGVIVSEVVLLQEAVHVGGFTTLFFQGGLQYSYKRGTVTINANVVPATHGEMVQEVLGSGSGALANQRFILKKPPLTYVSAATPSGAASTLEVRVSDVLWSEAPSLYGLAPDDRSYAVRHADDGSARVVFGDGLQGARLPTGVENVVGTYRTGIGLAGEVEAGTLTVLQSRPLGIRSVTSPVGASGAADPETLARARANAPLTVRTLDRIVSLADYTDFAAGFAGIGKAQAVELWDGRKRLVHLTIASESGEAVEGASELFVNLVAAIEAARARLEAVGVSSFQRVYFNVEAKVRVDGAYEGEAVLAAAEEALRAAFGFENRGFGQGVTAAEVVSVIHGVDGVVAVDLDALYRVTDAGVASPTLSAVLAAAGARWEASGVAAAELLLINPAGITVREVAP